MKKQEIQIRKRRKGENLPEPAFLPRKFSDTGKKTGYQYKPEYARQVYFLTLLGLTVEQVGQVLDVKRDTVVSWRSKHPEFNRAFVEGKIAADSRVANGLFLAAIGYSHPDQVVLTNRQRKYDKNGKVVREWTEPLIVPVTKHYPPNVTAAIKWLSVRQPGIWSEKIRIDGNFQVNHKLDLTDFTTEELEMLSKLGVAKQGRILEQEKTGYEDYTEYEEE